MTIYIDITLGAIILGAIIFCVAWYFAVKHDDDLLKGNGK